jgi:hypothetical protein
MTVFIVSLAWAEPGQEGSRPPETYAPAPVAVTAVPGAGISLELVKRVRADVAWALAGRAQPGVAITLTIDAAGVDIQVGRLSRRVAVAFWDDVALRTVALHVLDLMQPEPDLRGLVRAPPEANAEAAPRAESDDGSETLQIAAAPPSASSALPWWVHASVAGTRGTDSINPWMVAVAAGLRYQRDWLRASLDVGWDHAAHRSPDGITRASYDGWPVRLAIAAGAGLTVDTNVVYSTPRLAPFAGLTLEAALP